MNTEYYNNPFYDPLNTETWDIDAQYDAWLIDKYENKGCTYDVDYADYLDAKERQLKMEEQNKKISDYSEYIDTDYSFYDDYDFTIHKDAWKPYIDRDRTLQENIPDKIEDEILELID